MLSMNLGYEMKGQVIKFKKKHTYKQQREVGLHSSQTSKFQSYCQTFGSKCTKVEVGRML